MEKAVFFKKLPNKVVRCEACAWYCRTSPDQAGVCSVRQNLDGELYLLVYGRAAAANIDPMEKKPLFHFLPGQEIFSLGTLGCNLACSFCQNWDISQATKGKSKPEENYGMELPPEKIVALCREKNLPAVAFTYNEPAIFLEYALDTMHLAKKAGLKTVFVSNGYESPETRAALKGQLDAINIDLKSFRDEFYQKICKARLAPVLENIAAFHKDGVWVEVTTLLIPGENDSPEELTAIAEFLAGISKDLPWHLSRFHPDYQMTDKEQTPEPTLYLAREIGRKAGLRYVYLGNVLTKEGEDTFCPQCHSTVVHRSGYQVNLVNLKDGHCGSCHEPLAGRWI